MSTCKVVGTLAKYAIPLNLVLILDDFGDIALNLSIARSTLNGGDAKDAIYGLAAFGASHRLVRFAWGPAKAMRSVGVRMIDNVRDYKNSIFFVLITSLPFFAFMILASTTSFGGFVSGIRPETQTGIYLSQSLFYMSILPFIQAFCRLHEGLLLSFQLSHIVSFAAVMTLVGQIFSIVVLLYISNLPTKMIVPPMALYFGFFCKILVLLYGTYFHAWEQLKSNSVNLRQTSDTREESEGENEIRHTDTILSASINAGLDTNLCKRFVVLLKFWAPLGATQLFQTVSRPFINYLVATSKHGEIGLAVLTLCFPVGHLHYGWVNSHKSMLSAFKSDFATVPRYMINRYILGAGILSLTIGFVFLWSDLSKAVMRNIIGADESLIALADVPLKIFTFHTCAVTVRCILSGIMIVDKETKLLYLPGPVRLCTIVTVGFVLLYVFGVSGATLGVAALFSGFCGEAITVLVQYVLNAKRKSKRDKKENPTCFRILRDVFFPSSLHSYSQTSFREEDIAVGDGDDGDAAEKKKAVLKEVEILS